MGAMPLLPSFFPTPERCGRVGSKVVADVFLGDFGFNAGLHS